MTDTTSETARAGGTPSEVFRVFLKLGLTSFGGPIAHLGYFRDELVTRRRWISESGYADLVALCQFLPGPASSQVGLALGLMRGGPLGALAAWIAFTLPSALLLIAFGFGAATIGGPLAGGVLNGLKIVAVAIVAQAVWGMARSLCPDRERAAIAVGAIVVVAAMPGAFGQIGAIALGMIAGLALGRGRGDALGGGSVAMPISRGFGLACLALFFGLLILLPLVAGQSQTLAVVDAFYRAGALVFGGGHVVLPLLETEVVRSGWVSPDDFLAGYGAAQAVPGPLFTFAAFLGTVLQPAPNGFLGAAIALAAVFAGGFLILLGALPFWDRLRTRPRMQSLMQGANAAVVGILGAALYSPVFTSAIVGLPQFALAAGCFVLLMAWKCPPWIVVLVAAIGGAALTAI
ncbi:MAG: chromate efflux transporter [Alphaproteobacteria bacterium]